MRAFVRWVAIGAVLGAFHALAACNAVLGIDKAELAAADGADGAVCKSGQGATLMACADASSACEGCVTACGSQVSSCLGNSACRQALADYRTCQRDDCVDATQGCGACLTAQSGAGCFAGCTDKCNGSELVDRCTLYCSCMSSNCSNRFADPAACMTFCAKQEPWRTYCQLDHCELAGVLPQSDHCFHADDTKPVCVAAPSNPTCTDKKLAGRACQLPSDCCSQACSNEGTCL